MQRYRDADRLGSIKAGRKTDMHIDKQIERNRGIQTYIQKKETKEIRG